MAILVGDNFNYRGQKPNFERDRFLSIADMKAYPETSIDNGHISYCVEDNTHYTFNSSNSVDSTLGRWRKFSSGGSMSGEDRVDLEYAKGGADKIEALVALGVPITYGPYNCGTDSNNMWLEYNAIVWDSESSTWEKGEKVKCWLTKVSSRQSGYMTPAMFDSLNTVISDVTELKSTINISNKMIICTQDEYNAIQDKEDDVVYLLKG